MAKIQMFFKNYRNQNLALTAILIVTGLLTVNQTIGFSITLGNLLLMIASILAGVPILLRAISALKARVISIELLVSIAVIGAFIIGEYNESAIVTFLFMLGDFLEEKTLAKTRQSIKSLAEISPTVANVKSQDGEIVTTDVEDVEIGDIVVVKPGGKVPIDGVVVSGSGYLDEAAITGESLEVQKESNQEVFSGSVLTNGYLEIKATKEADDTTFAKILELVEEAQDTKSKAEKFIDQFAKFYTPAVLVLAIVVLAFTQNFKLAITVLVLGCPGALVIGAPVSNVAGIGNGAKHGVLIKGGTVIDDFAKIDTFVFDKTGTLTTGKTKVTSFIGDANPNLLAKIKLAESISDHPLGRAIVDFVTEKMANDASVEISNNQVVKGQGLIVDYQDGSRLFLGNEKLIHDYQINLDEEQQAQIIALQKSGASIVLVGDRNQVQVVIGISDSIKPHAKAELARLRQAGAKKLVMLTGDNPVTAGFVGNELGLDEVHAGLLPEDKAKFIKELQAHGEKVAFVGDGINDSPSLATANIGIAMGSGTDVAIETSDVVLMNSSIKQLVYGYRLSQKTVLNTRENIAIAIGVVLFLLTGLLFGFIYMASGMFVHEASILVVILNAMRLLTFGRQKPEKVDLDQVKVPADDLR